MAILKTRVSGAWVDSDRVGAVRYEGATIPYGPPSVSYEAVNWVSPPTLTDATDSTTYVMGCSFTVVTSKPCYGIRWRVTDTITTPGGSGQFYATLFSLSPNTKLAQKVFTPVAGGDQDILFDTPVTLSTSLTYTVSILTVRYSFRTASSVGGFPFSSPSGNVVASTGRLSTTTDPDTVPGGDFASIFYISPLVGL